MQCSVQYRTLRQYYQMPRKPALTRFYSGGILGSRINLLMSVSSQLLEYEGAIVSEVVTKN